MVKKIEGAKMSCPQCGKELVCGWSNYPAPYKNKLQWQNKDGSAHFMFKEGSFICTTTIDERKKLKQAMKFQDELMKDAELTKG